MTASDDANPSSFHRALGRCSCAACGGAAQRAEAAGDGELAATAGPDVSAAANGAADYGLTPEIGDVRIDGLLAGTRWAVDEAMSGLTITYSFGLSAAAYGSGYGYGEPLDGFAALTAVGQQAVRAALVTWSTVADINFVEVGGGLGGAGTIRFAHSAVPDTAWGYYPESYTEAGDIWLGQGLVGSTFERGSYAWSTLVHEIGHALGLKHPHDPGFILGNETLLPESLDWLGQTVMSYKDFPGDAPDYYTADYYPNGPMQLDILAIQHLYGANDGYNSGDTVYAFTGERMFQTIWDAGGIDTIDWSNQATAAVIRLDQGAFSDLGEDYGWREDGGGHLPGTLAIASGVAIENAIGGSSDDMIYGNPLDNRLEGGAGIDFLVGSIGNDVLIGGTSADTLIGGSGNDVMLGGTNTDTLTAGSGNDILFGDTGSDTLDAGSGNDFLVGGTSNDTLLGGSGGDVAIYAGLRRDFTIAKSSAGYTVRDNLLTDGNLGTDTLRDVEALLFNDGLYDLGSRRMTPPPPTLPELDQLVLTA